MRTGKDFPSRAVSLTNRDLAEFGVGALALASLALAVAACGGGSPNPGAGDGGADGGVPPKPSEYGLDTRPANTTCVAPARPPSDVPVRFEQVFDTVELAAPMMIEQPPGDSTRWFAALRGGTLVSFPADGTADPTEVADIPELAGLDINASGEGGFLGFAFHPDFESNGEVYVTWTSTGGANGMRSLVGVLTSSDDGASFDSYAPILGFDQTSAQNHKGGGIAFGGDGYLYVAFGDGGNGDDFFIKGQKKTEFFSKVLRIDVDTTSDGKNYGIPGDNPFVGVDGYAPEVFAYGFRNPFRISVDKESNQLWVADVGQNQYEEVNRVSAGGNYGWPCREAKHDYITTEDNASKCPSMAGLIDPIVEHQHSPNNSRSITGGVVYRGSEIPGFVGNYVYGDYKKKELWAISFDISTGDPEASQLNDPDPSATWVNFANDNAGEVYAVAIQEGAIYKLVPADDAPPGDAFPGLLSETGCVDAGDPTKVALGLVPYGINAPLWSDGADKARYMALPEGETITVNADGDFEFPIGTVLLKTFSIGGKRVETRLFVRHDDGDWAGYSYEWRDDESDAVLLPSSKSKNVGDQIWYYPSRSECLTCHTAAAGRALGPEIGQLNGDFTYRSTNRLSNQLRTLEHIGMFAADLGGEPETLTVYPDPLGDGAVDARARAYLHSNCSNCHRPEGGGGDGDMDLRFATDFAATGTCNEEADGETYGIAGVRRLVPGEPAKSLLSVRPHAEVLGRMPPLGSRIVDTEGLKAVDGWITDLETCP
jgi:uncharacterized repeat protein (TIGR03806 family)